ncbi:MAG: type II toxin-antitoxin system YafQ family toxin [Balneolales bacterium]
MKQIGRTSRFKKDVKLMQKRGKSFTHFKKIIKALAESKPLDERYRDHKLTGSYASTRECHIQPDWLLIYEATDDELILIRTGTHADLFG